MERFAIISCATVCALLFCAPAQADDASKDAKLHELASLLNIKENLSIENAATRKQAKSEMDRMLSGLFTNAPNASDDIKKKIKKISDDYIREASAPLDRVRAENLWCQYYGRGLSEDDLDKIISFYKSPIGQIDLKAKLALQSVWSSDLSRQRGEIVQKAMASYIVSFKAIFADAQPEK